MALAGPTRQRLLEGEILLPPEQEEITDRRVVVGAAKDGVSGNAHAAGKRDRGGRVPAGGRHAPHDIFFAADEADIDRIARVAVAGRGDPRRLSQERMLAEVAPPELWDDQIGGYHPDQGDSEQRLGIGQMQAEMQHRRAHAGLPAPLLAGLDGLAEAGAARCFSASCTAKIEAS